MSINAKGEPGQRWSVFRPSQSSMFVTYFAVDALVTTWRCVLKIATHFYTRFTASTTITTNCLSSDRQFFRDSDDERYECPDEHCFSSLLSTSVLHFCECHNWRLFISICSKGCHRHCRRRSASVNHHMDKRYLSTYFVIHNMGCRFETILVIVVVTFIDRDGVNVMTWYRFAGFRNIVSLISSIGGCPQFITEKSNSVIV